MKFLQYFPHFCGHLLNTYFHFSILASISTFGSRVFILNNADSRFAASTWDSRPCSTNWSKT